ncbi:MAG: 8-oxo-dGTP diphosphatase [Firmicutes bacterium]|nr:8-oxo-dGTP diphosphatase [Bacillota bacterium]
MRLTTLCYMEKDEKYLMLHRTKKQHDFNGGKWIGVGGKFEQNETPEECLLREVREETGLDLVNYTLRGIITFISDEWETEYMYLYTADKWTGELTDCDEGELKWIEKDKVPLLELWEGDRLFLELLNTEKRFFSMKLRYEGETLAEHSVKVY